MASPKTICRQCGTAILQITADLNDGRCMPCTNAERVEKEIKPQVAAMIKALGARKPPILDHRTDSEDVLVSISFDPGWSPDLTSWIVQISPDGIMRQAIQWHRPGQPRDQEELEPVRLNDDAMTKLRHFIAEAESLKLSEIKHLSYIDDASMVSMRVPRSGEHADVPMLHLQEDLRRGRRKLTEIEKPRFAVVEAIWKLANSHSRYTIGEHYRS